MVYYIYAKYTIPISVFCYRKYVIGFFVSLSYAYFCLQLLFF